MCRQSGEGPGSERRTARTMHTGRLFAHSPLRSRRGRHACGWSDGEDAGTRRQGRTRGRDGQGTATEMMFPSPPPPGGRARGGDGGLCCSSLRRSQLWTGLTPEGGSGQPAGMRTSRESQHPPSREALSSVSSPPSARTSSATRGATGVTGPRTSWSLQQAGSCTHTQKCASVTFAPLSC